MVKRVVDTKFWTSMQVIDNYSVEDKFFALYLMTNDKSTQVGIYSLPKKVISFETGFTTDVIQVLLDRFGKDYGKIVYSEKTQEVALLKSLQYSILKGGKPVSDLLERELRDIQDGTLILETYKAMQSFWASSRRVFDQTIQSIFEEELMTRKLLLPETEEQNGNINQNDNDSNNHNDYEESLGTNHGTNQELVINTDETNQDELLALERYIQYLMYKKPDFNQVINSKDILHIFYKELLGEVTIEVEEKFKKWEEKLPKSLILEALVRSIDTFNPLLYASSIIENWLKDGVKDSRDVARLDREYSRENN